VDEHAETPPLLHELQDFLYNQAHRGLARAGNTDPPSGFRLVADRVAALAELAYAPESSDVSTGRRYIRFVHEHFPDAYRERELGGLILTELYLTPPFLRGHASRLATVDSITARNMHLSTDGDGHLVLRWPEFVADYESARDRFWNRLLAAKKDVERVQGLLAGRRPIRAQREPDGHVTGTPSEASQVPGAPSRFLSLNELMDALGGSRTWWNVQIRNGLPRQRWGKGFYRYSLDEVLVWLEEQPT
jgi:predicted DNA-binding transcriptional regulator AlpA